MKDGKGNVKEYYYDGELLFEGEYLNGERNWKGKEYFDGQLKYEGEYLNGERNEKGKEYDDLGCFIIFEGEYLNGERWNGIGKNHYENGQFIFQEKYLNGKLFKIEGNRFKPINYGTFLGYILDNLKNENKLKRNKKLNI